MVQVEQELDTLNVIESLEDESVLTEDMISELSSGKGEDE